MQTRNERNIPGIDVSRYQGDVDWSKVARQGFRFVFIKATEGIGYVDPYFARNAAEAKAAGLKIGFYHFARPETGNTPTAEAEHYLSTTSRIPADLPHVLDVEGKAASLGRAGLTNWCEQWLVSVEQRTGQRAMIYTGASFARTYLDASLGRWPLWVAHYGVEQPLGNSVWDRWSVFQYTDAGRSDGIAGPVDLDEMDLEFWREVTGELENKMNFTDVPDDHWARNVIQIVSEIGIMTGYEDGTFRPDQPVTRAELAKVVNDLLYLIGQK